MKVPGTAPKLRLNWSLYLQEGSNYFAMNKIYCTIPKITGLTEYEMDFLRIYK